MSTYTTVEVFLGHSITVASENQFLARLRHDLSKRGVSARILANLHVGRDALQVDFVVITERRVVQIEEKTFRGPIIDGPKNGPWKVRVGANDVRERGNPLRQALNATHALSDELHAFADRGGAPSSRAGKFYSDIDTIVCGFPVMPKGSHFDQHPYVSVLGYDALLNRLQRPGPRIPWSDADWDAFGQHLNLYRADDESPEGIVRGVGAAAVDAYLGHYVHAQEGMPTLVPTTVSVNTRPAPRPDLADELAAGRVVLLHGPSELGKTLWARTVAAELARSGHVPIWLAGDVCEGSFRTSLARAIAPYTSLSPGELLKAADAAGRAVVFVIDDLTKASGPVRQALLEGAQAVRVRNITRGVLITAQAADAAASLPDCLDVALAVPNDAERQALLDAYGAPEIIDRCDAFVTPLELSLAAAYAGELAPGASAAELLDRHIDRVVAGDDQLRDALRTIARRMHTELMPSLARPDLARRLRRDHRITDATLRALLSCPIVTVAHGRVSFRHERFEHFLAAEAMMLNATDPDVLAQRLNTPRGAELRADAIALESDEDGLGVLLSACEDPDALVAAATGRLGPLAAHVTDRLLTDTLNVACAQTAAGGMTFQAAEAPFFGRWTMPDSVGAATKAHLIAIGRLLRQGRYAEEVARLLDHTDALCSSALATADSHAPLLADQLFATTYALRGPGDELAGSTVVHAANEHFGFDHGSRTRAVETAVELLRRANGPGLGALWVAEHLVRFSGSPLVADVILKSLKSDLYHPRLLGLQLAEESAHGLDASGRQAVVDAINALPVDNLGISTSVVEALSALGELTPARDLDDIAGEITTVLATPQDPQACKMAYGIVANQFETDAIGPYYEAVHDLPNADRERLLAMALVGSDTDWIATSWIIGEFDHLADPLTRAAIVRYVGRTDPSDWFSPQLGMEGLVGALRLLAAEGAPLPDPIDNGSTDPAWRACMTVIMGALADAGDWPVRRQCVDEAWAALTGRHRDVLASLLLNLSHVDLRPSRQERTAVHELVVAALPPNAIDALIWAVEHPDDIRSLPSFDHGVRDHVIRLLGLLGDRRAADALRRLAEDPELGEAAAAAVRAIENRALA
jgi:hypothetical protein